MLNRLAVACLSIPGSSCLISYPPAVQPHSARVMAAVRHCQFGPPPRTQCATAVACGCHPHVAPGRISGH